VFPNERMVEEGEGDMRMDIARWKAGIAKDRIIQRGNVERDGRYHGVTDEEANL